MKPTGTACPVLLALGILASSPALAGAISGRLILKDRPAYGVTVSAIPYETPREEAARDARKAPRPEVAAATKSGPSGAFVLALPEGPAGREYRLHVGGGGVIPGFAPGAYDPGETTDVGDLFVEKGEELRGRIVLPPGVAAKDVEVVLSSPAGPGDSSLEPAPESVHPGPDGTFAFPAAHRTRNLLTVRADGFWMSPLTERSAGALAQPIPLHPSSPVAGIVRKKDRETPAAGVLVRVNGDPAARWTTSGRDGSFRIDSAAPGTCRIVADGGDDGMAEAALPGSTRAAALLTLGTAGGIEGRTIDRTTGKALPRVRISIARGNASRQVRSGSDGRFGASDLLPGSYTVTADDPRFVPWKRGSISVPPGGSVKLDVVLVAGASISGRVVDDRGAPVAQAKGALAPADLTGLRSLASGGRRAFATGADGTFRATRLEPGENLRLSVRHPDFEEGAVGGLTLAPGSVRNGLEAVLRRGISVIGVVRDEKKAPVAGVEIWFAPSFEASSAGGSGTLPALMGLSRIPSQRTTTGPDGTFTVRGASPGKYQLGGMKNGFSMASGEAVVPPRGETPKVVELTLLPGGTIAGIVRYADGSPASGRLVSAALPGTQPGATNFSISQPTGPDGLFSVPYLRAGALYDLDIFEGRQQGAPKVRAVPAPSDGVEIVLATPGRIGGVVVDAASREPLPDFQVWYDRDRSSSQGRMPPPFSPGNRRGEPRGAGSGDRLAGHAEDGTFLLEEIPAGAWEVDVEAKGYQPARVGGIVIEEGTARSGLQVALSSGATLRGTVVDGGSGRSVADARISLAQAGGGAGSAPGFLSREAGAKGTDGDGRFEIDGIGPGKYVVSAGHSDYASGSESVEVAEAGATVKVSLTSGNRVSGVVLDENRRPVPGAAVNLGSGTGGGDQGTLADGSGRFRFDRVSAGRYSATAGRTREVTKAEPVVVLDGQPRDDVTLAFTAGAVVRGAVTGLSPADLPNVSVYYRGPGGFAGFAKAGSDGRFEIRGAGEGTLNVSANVATGGQGSSRNVNRDVVLAAGQAEAEVEIPFVPGALVSGTVTQGGRPVPNASVIASPRDGQKTVAVGKTEEDGTFRLNDLARGTYSVTARASMYDSSGTRKSVQVDGDTVVDLELPVRKVTGRVVEAGSGAPLADASVSATAQAPVIASARSASTDSSGTFSIEGLDSATWSVTASKRGFIFRPQTAALTSSDTADVRLEGTRADSIGIHAVDGLLGFPLRSVFVHATRPGGGSEFRGSVPLDGDGRGEIPSLEPGSYTLVVRSGGYAPAILGGVAAPSPLVEVRLTPGGALEIRSGNKTLEKGTARATLTGAGGAPYPATEYADDGGIAISSPLFRIDHVVPGSYTLTVAGGEPHPFTIVEGGAAVVTLP